MIEVSVICPIRNEEQFIETCLMSLVSQSYPAEKMEILVVDGMSTDATRDIVKEISEKYPHVKLLDNPKQIVPAALNIGIRAAKGRYIIRLDGHAKADVDFVAENVKLLAAGKTECVGGPIISVNESETGKVIAAAMSSSFGVGNARFRTGNNAEAYVDTVAFPGFLRKVFDDVGLFDEAMVRCQDDEFNFRIRANGGRILLSPKIKSWYYPRTSFKKLWRQYFGYGFWKIRVMQKHPAQMSWRHFVPAAFVATLTALTVAGFWIPKLWYGLLAILGLYIGASLGAAAKIRQKTPDLPLWKLLVAFYILHVAYGTGFIVGFIKFFPYWIKSPASKSAYEK